MSARKKTKIGSWLIFNACLMPFVISLSAAGTNKPASGVGINSDGPSLARDTLAKQLGWVDDSHYFCGGYYLEQPLIYPISVNKGNTVEVTTNSGLLSQRSTSILVGSVTITRSGQQITANRAYLYRDPNTDKLAAIDMIGNVNLREPNTLIIGKKGRYNFETTTKSLIDILYRTTMNIQQKMGGKQNGLQNKHKITTMTAWGKAYEFSQTEPRIYELYRASYSTCPPENPTWRVKASHIVLNKNTGRGYATNVRLLVKSVPVVYLPYLNFSIDGQRKSGFLWPTYGGGNQTGPSIYTPFYWNMAPNYDMTITPGYMSKRGTILSDNFRYLTPTTYGNIYASVVPHDRAFDAFQKSSAETFSSSTDPVVQADLNRLVNDNDTRKSFLWRQDSRYNDHWSSHVDFNYAGDDYYLKNFGSNLNEVTSNQLLQEGDVTYQGQNWNFIGRLQTYQTLHPVDELPVTSQYRRFPQLILNGDYPDQALGLEYFVNNEITHFDIRNTPGTETNEPIGNRFHIQPGVSLPVYMPSYYINPRLQFALTDYSLTQTSDTGAPGSKQRALPIFDIASGLMLFRDVTLFANPYQQTLEPQVYYTYIPYRNQASIPVFDTTVNTLVYDQIFNYNRFSGIDRIGDANQVGLGVSSRFIDQNSGLEKVRVGIGEIVYFAHRKVTLCNDNSCVDNPDNHSNQQRLSPISGLFNYNINPAWSFRADAIWDPVTKYMENTTMTFQYEPEDQHIVNLSYTFARSGDPLSGIVEQYDPSNNLKVTTISYAWPLIRDISGVGLWSQNWNQTHLQNLVVGLQYDTCCWAVRVVGGRTFTGLDPNENNRPQYNTEGYIQFALKGLGEIGSGNPSGLLSSITGYKTQFGQVI